MNIIVNVTQGFARKRPFHLATMLLCAMFLQGCQKANEAETTALVTVQAERPVIGEISEHIMADATLSPLAQAAISPKITAPVRTFYVQRGSKVKAGQLLAVLENRDLTAQEIDNRGQYSAAQAEAQLNLQRDITASRKKLLQEGAIAGREYDTANAALVQAQASYESAQNRLMSLQKVSRAATIRQAEGQLSSAKGRYLSAQAQVSYSEICSPISGVVTDRPLFPGETANSGNTLVTVMDTSALLAKVHLSQTATQRLTVGDEASVVMPGMDDPVPAKITLISPALDPGSTTVEVWLRIENGSGKYKSGTPVRASISGRTVTQAIKVPLSAVLTDPDGSKSIMTVGADGTAHKRAVQLGINDGKDVEVTHGISGSETVIITGAYGLDEGTKVQNGKADEDKANGEKN